VVAEAAKRVGALIVCDASQAAGAMPIDVASSGIDVLAVAGYKTLLAPYGTGLGVFSERALHDLSASEIVWWSVEGSENFNRLPGADFRMRSDASRFDAHEPASFIQLAALCSSLRMLNEIGPERVAEHSRALVRRLVSQRPPAFVVASPTADDATSHVVCFEGPDCASVRARLEAARIRVSIRSDRLRISPYLYNDEADIDRLVEALAVV
jgi:selenocysteine lyase/cysteine desulfurase